MQVTFGIFHRVLLEIVARLVAFVEESFHNAVENGNLGIFWRVFIVTNLAPPKNSSGAKFIQGEWRNFHRAHDLFAGVEFHVLPRVLVCFLVEFDLLFAISVLSCRILDCASLFIYVHKHDRLCFPMLTVETAVFDCICWLSSSRDRKGQSYPVEYYLESVEEYSEGTVQKGEPEPRNGNVNAVHFINQARRNTRISRTEFIYDESMRLQNYSYLYLSFLLRIMFVKKYTFTN